MFSVIVPMKNEPDPEHILGRIHEVLVDLPEDYEVLVVTGDREREPFKLPNFPRTRHIFTYGDSLERSILNGFSHSCGEFIAVMDADGSHPPEKLLVMWQLLHDYEMVVGSRYLGESKYHASLGRGLFSKLGKGDAQVAGSKMTDPMSGFFAIRRELLSRCRFKPLTWKTGLEIELCTHPKLKEIAIEFKERSIGKSQNHFLNALRLHFELEGWMFDE